MAGSFKCYKKLLNVILGGIMAVVRIDDKLLKEIKKFLEDDRNRYHHPSVSAFINYALYEKITKLRLKARKGRQL